MSDAGQNIDLRMQVAKQCAAVKHLAAVIASMHGDYSKLFSDASCRGPDDIIESVGRRTAYLMETLGNILNGMDACDEDDDWLDPIFKEAQRLWPVTEK